MPNRDGTGPCGSGPGTGRGGGRWSRFNLFGSRPGRGRITVFAAIAPLLGALVKDITNPSGIVRQVIKKMLAQRKVSDKNKEINASYTVISEDNSYQNNGRSE